MLCLLTLVLSLFLTTQVYAEQWVCFDSVTKRVNKVVEGDGMRLGICGLNNSNIDPNCILATAQEYDLAKQAYKKVDKSVISGSRVIDLTQAEKDAILQAEADAQKNAQIAIVDKFDITAKDAFTAWIKIYNSKVPLQYRVTRQEIKDQIKKDLGLNP